MDSTHNLDLTQQAQLANLQIAGAISRLSISFQRYPDQQSLPANPNTNLISPERPGPCSSMARIPVYLCTGLQTCCIGHEGSYAMRYSANTTYEAAQSPDTDTYCISQISLGVKRPIPVLRLHVMILLVIAFFLHLILPRLVPVARNKRLIRVLPLISTLRLVLK